MKKVAIIDSGSGGINVLAKCIKFCPCFNYLLYIDDKNLPYGEKTRKELQKIAIETIEQVKKIFSPKIIIIGCNTLTTVALHTLKIHFPEIIFIGTEPEVEKVTKKELLILATKRTVNDSPLLKDLQDYCFIPNGLPEIIDSNLLDRDRIEEYIKTLPNGDYKNIVLGCTHFEGIKKELLKKYPSATFFEGSDKVVKELKRHAYGSSFQVQIISSREKFSSFYSYFSSITSDNKFL